MKLQLIFQDKRFLFTFTMLLQTHYYLRIVHVAPDHDAVQAQTPELMHVPPFEQAGKHAAKYAKTDMSEESIENT